MNLHFPLDISQYKLGKVIGRGATATVYTAKCLTNGKEIAIKLINLEVCPIEIENLRSEISFWSRCDNPFIVKYYGSFIERSTLYILMEYMNIGSISEIIKFGFRKGIPKEKYIAAILRDILSALVYFHENNQIHRDIKPGNILLNQNGDIKIGDFGIAANLLEHGQRLNARFTIIGTPCYMAPEVVAAQGYSGKADVWSLGISAIELATGIAPYANLYPLEVIVKISNSPPPTLPDDGNFSYNFKEFVKAALQYTPSKRPTAEELLNYKFIKQAATKKEMAELFGSIPTIEEQYELIHGSAPEENRVSPDGIKADWDFSTLDDNEAVDIDSSLGEQPNEQKITHSLPTVIQKGKFTITKHTKPDPPSNSINIPEPPKQSIISSNNDESIIIDLKNRVYNIRKKILDLKKENSNLKTALELLSDQIHEIQK